MPWLRRLRLATALFALLFALLLALPASAQATEAALPPELDPATAPLDAQLALDGRVKKGVLGNGLTYLVRANGTPEKRADVWLVVNAGSVIEDDDQRGVAHFVEHMCFNGTRRFPRQRLVDYLESVGLRFGADLNAYTGFDETVYTLRVPTDRPEVLETAFQILADWIGGGVSFEPAEVEKERGVVVEEWRLGRDANGRLADQQLPALLHGSRYAERRPIGELSVIEKAPVETFARFYRDWYRPDLAAVIAVGDIDPTAVEQQILKHFASIPKPPSPRARPVTTLPEHEETLFSIVSDPELTQTLVGVYYKHARRPEARVGDYRRFLAENLYDVLVNSRLSEIAQKADAPFLYGGASSEDLVRTASAYVQLGLAREGGVEPALEALLTEAERIDRHGFTASELERAKTLTRRRYEQATAEDGKSESNALAAEFSRHFLEGEPVPGIAGELALVARFLPGITLEEINQIGRDWIREVGRVVMVSGPEKPGKELPDREHLAAVFDKAAKAEVAAYVDRTLDEPLMAARPEPGRIEAESSRPALGITEWRLSNGALVVLKPTDFQNDEVLLAAFSPGGTSLVADEDYNSAIFATALLSESGLGRFPKVELEKALAGKITGLDVSIQEVEENLTASASRVDLEAMFQLVHLAFTAPRAEKEAASAFLSKLGDLIADRLASPENVFRDRLNEALYQNHPRRQPLTRETLATIDVDRALSVYRQRFADAADFTFVLVGTFTPSEIRPLVETYLGGLPTLGKHERFRDIGLSTPATKVDVRVEKGSEPKAEVALVFSGETAFTLETAHAIDTLADVLSLRLRDILREDRGQVYGVSVAGEFLVRPRPSYSFSISFGCAPENVNPLLDAVFAEVKRIRKRGITEAELAKIQETQRSELASAQRRNGYWLRSLTDSYRLGITPERFLERQERIDGLTRKGLKKAAKRYFDLDRYVLGVLGPEPSAQAAVGASAASSPGGRH